MSGATALKLLLVANPGEAEDIARLLVGAGLPEPAIGWGGDETLLLCEETMPHVAVLCATLDQGDARSLASAMRGVRGPAIRIVLVGDTSGPIRNALDASDFEVDRFVGRPLSAKALAFAIRSCANESMAAELSEASAPEPTPPAAAEIPPATGPEEPGMPRRRPGFTGPIDRAMEEAISRFVADAMDALDVGWVIDPGGSVVEAPAGAAPRNVELEATAKVANPEDVPGWRDEPVAWREPTLILSGGGSGPVPRAIGAGADSPSAAASMDIDITAPQSASPWDEPDDDQGGPFSATSARARAAERDEVDLLDLELSFDEESADLRTSPPGRATPPPRAQTPPPRSGTLPPADTPAPTPPPAEPVVRGALGRELRRKMSAMAERLFQGRGERPAVDVGLAHDAHTEIDLTAIAAEPLAASGGPAAPYEEIGTADTFADTNPLSRLEPTPSPDAAGAEELDETTGRRRSAVTGEPPAKGDLADLDVASLLGRLLQSRFTGRVHFRRGPADKTVHFEDGRPIFATSNLPHDRMGDLLYREGKITREQQQRARDLVVESGRRMGEILVEIGFLKPRELLPAVRHHIEDILYSLFAWDTGEFAISPGDPPGERIRLTRHPAAIVLEGVRRKYGPEHLEARLGSPAAVVAVRSSRQLGAIAAVADLSPPERAVMQKLDGERTIEQVAEAAQVDHLVALQLAFALVGLGVAEVVDHGPAAADRATPVRSRALVGETDIAIDRQRVLAKHALVNEADYFTLLGVRRDATSFEIRRAYEAARRDYASVGFPLELQRELAGQLSEINQLIEEAYQVLRDERVRRSYHQHLFD